MQAEQGFAVAAVIQLPLVAKVSSVTGWNPLLVLLMSLPLLTPPIYGVIEMVAGRIWAMRNPEEAAKAAARLPRSSIDTSAK